MGPWDQAFFFTLRSEAKSKSNYRQDSANRGQWATLRAFANQVFLAARSARPAGWDAGDPAKPVSARPRIVAYVFARTMLDVGNLDKSVLDAVEASRARAGRPGGPGVVMVSDAQVAASVNVGERTAHNPGALVAFARLAPGASPGDVARAMVSLITQCTDLLVEIAPK